MRDLDPEADDLEGYLFPDTYDLPQAAAPERALVHRMTQRFRRWWRRSWLKLEGAASPCGSW